MILLVNNGNNNLLVKNVRLEMEVTRIVMEFDSLACNEYKSLAIARDYVRANY